MKKQIDSSIIRLIAVLIVGVLAISPLFPRHAAPLGAPADEFSAQRALSHLPIIARAPHPAGSAAQLLVRDYLVEQLTQLGLDVEVQAIAGVENVVARLPGSDSSGAILLQAHYDSMGGPGAADNGAGVAALLEIMRALASGPVLANDVIALFDDGEEGANAFRGTKAFIRSHSLMPDVRVAIGMDTAVGGFIAVDDTGPDNNGWLVDVLAHVYKDGAWTSLSGGGGYDTKPFREAGVRVLELEDNYPFSEQHTGYDTPEIVNPGSLQQLGEQALAVVREISGRNLNNTSGPQRTFLYLPYVGLLHYPEAWALPLSILAGIFLVSAFILALWTKDLTWRGFGIGLLATTFTAAPAALLVNALWKAAPRVLGWKTASWLDWPEVIPPNGWLVLVLGYALVLVLTLFIYRFVRRWSPAASFSFTGLFAFLLLAVAVAIVEPKGAIIFTWPVLIGAVIRATAFALRRYGVRLPTVLIALLASMPTIVYLLPLLVSVFMSDGTKSVAITSAVWVFVLSIILPGLDDLIVRAPGRSVVESAQQT